MLIVVSPAKTLDFESPLPTRKHSEPALLDRSELLVARLRRMSAPKLGALMDISDKLAKENAQRYRTWSRPFTPDNAPTAVFAFRGDVYQGLDADTLTARNLDWAQKHLRILSGLYGVLRPLDLMQPYRLEMGRPLAADGTRNLYGFWGETITDLLIEAMKAARTKLLVNLASKEYFDSVQPDRLAGEVVSPVFKEKRDGKLRMISFSAKRARGAMARYVIESRARTRDDLEGFRADGYRLQRSGSTADAPLFVRPGPVRASA